MSNASRLNQIQKKIREFWFLSKRGKMKHEQVIQCLIKPIQKKEDYLKK